MHVNDGACAKCQEIFDRYPGFNEELWSWFKAIQVESPEAHIACAGRGKIDQELAFHKGASKAHYGQSSHNYNCAIDIFELRGMEAVWDKAWFQKVVGENLYPFLKWYGAPGASFYELPHVEVSDWKLLVNSGAAKLVEPK